MCKLTRTVRIYFPPEAHPNGLWGLSMDARNDFSGSKANGM